MPGPGDRGVLLAALGAALLLAITLRAMQLPTPLARDAPRSQFSATRAFDNLKDLVGDGLPHPIGSPANAKVRDAIVAKLQALGYQVELQSGWSCNPNGGCGYPTNIVASLPSTEPTDPLTHDDVLVAAHYDSVAAGPGASDDGVGVVAALEIARVLADSDAPALRHPVVILISDGEEGGLLGASLFAREHRLGQRVKAAVNMDSRGTSGLTLMFETGAANAWLMHLYARSIDRPITNSLFYVIYKLLPSDTDFSVFKAAGYQGFNFAFIGHASFYHTPLDSVSNASLASIQDQGGNALQALRALANAGELDAPIAESVFFDVWGRTLVVWPAKSIPAMTLGLLLLCLAAVAMLVRRGRAQVREIIWGLVGCIGNTVLGAALSIAAVGLLFGLGKVPPFLAGPWLAHPAAMSIATVAMALFSAAALSSALSKLAGYWGLWAGGALGFSTLSVVIAHINPGPVFPLLLATVAALLGVLPALLMEKAKPVPRWALECATLTPAWVLLAVVLPILMLLYQGLGAVGWPPSALVLCMTGSFLLPLLSVASPRLRRSLLGCSGGLALGGLLLTVWLPTFSPQWPQRINVEYWLDADTGRAHWWVQPGSMHLPEQMAAAASFDSTLRPRFTGTGQLGFSAPAPAIAAEPPRFELLSTTGNHHEYRLSSPRQAAKMLVAFPPTESIEQAALSTPQGPLPMRLIALESGAKLLAFANVPAAGVVLRIDSANSPSALIVDESYGLPNDLSQGKALQSARSKNATSSQDGDVTVLGRTVR